MVIQFHSIQLTGLFYLNTTTISIGTSRLMLIAKQLKHFLLLTGMVELDKSMKYLYSILSLTHVKLTNNLLFFQRLCHMTMTSQWTIKGKFFDLVVAPRSSLERLPSKETALPCTIYKRSER